MTTTQGPTSTNAGQTVTKAWNQASANGKVTPQEAAKIAAKFAHADVATIDKALARAMPIWEKAQKAVNGEGVNQHDAKAHANLAAARTLRDALQSYRMNAVATREQANTAHIKHAIEHGWDKGNAKAPMTPEAAQKLAAKYEHADIHTLDTAIGSASTIRQNALKAVNGQAVGHDDPKLHQTLAAATTLLSNLQGFRMDRVADAVTTRRN